MTCGGSSRNPSHTNAKLSITALLHLFSIYHRGGFQYCVEKFGPKTVYLFVRSPHREAELLELQLGSKKDRSMMIVK